MQVKDFFGDFSTKINLLYKEKNTDLDLLSRIEVKVTLSKLKELLDQYDKQNSEVSYLSLKPLFDFLADRWRYLKRTNATYFLKPNSAVNRGCCLLAEKLSSQFNIPIKDILMPSVAAKQNEKKYYQWRWHEFILDKNGDPFSIQACLSYSEEYKKSFLYQPVKKTILHNDTEERALVINHSEEAKKYYNAIRDFTVHGNNQERDLIAARDAFNQKIISDEYKVTASYGEAGENRLMDFLLKDCKNLHDLIQFLMTYVAMNNWKDFVKKIEDTKLIGLVKGKQVFLTDIVTAQSTYKKNNEIYNKAALLFLSEIYWRERNKKADYIGGVGPCSKEDKKIAVQVFQDFLCSDRPLNKLTRYVEEDPERKKAEYALLSDYPLFFSQLSDLVTIAKQAKIVTNPQFFEEKTASMLGNMMNVLGI